MPVTSSNPTFVTANRTSLFAPAIVQLVPSATPSSIERAAGAAAMNAASADVSNRLFSGMVPPLRSRTARERKLLTAPEWQGVLPVPEPALCGRQRQRVAPAPQRIAIAARHLAHRHAPRPRRQLGGASRDFVAARS